MSHCGDGLDRQQNVRKEAETERKKNRTAEKKSETEKQEDEKAKREERETEKRVRGSRRERSTEAWAKMREASSRLAAGGGWAEEARRQPVPAESGLWHPEAPGLSEGLGLCCCAGCRS